MQAIRYGSDLVGQVKTDGEFKRGHLMDVRQGLRGFDLPGLIRGLQDFQVAAAGDLQTGKLGQVRACGRRGQHEAARRRAQRRLLGAPFSSSEGDY